MGNDGAMMGKRSWDVHRYDEPGAAPSGFMIGGVPTGVIDERDPEKRHRACMFFFFLTNQAALKPASSMNFWDHWYGYH